ncbi:TPM domain-containing protein [Chryseobacterium daecheongense]|uniref:TPM domain-containing protein n=1 Tax=Chryseobacterium daecheongense TaxID=192389 RepID=UPI001FD63A21|nr:TPM domain-containing protein [Chryseobacterium daecheongense]UOU99995.1 TPM domain-containing protein [Chryseobacterium daecheongense]
MKKIVFFFLLFCSSIAYSQDYKVLAQRVCDSLKAFNTSDSIKLYGKEREFIGKELLKYVENLPETEIDGNSINYFNIFQYKVKRELIRNCSLKLNNNYSFFLFTQIVDFDNTFTYQQYQSLKNKIVEIRKINRIDILILEVDNFYPYKDITEYSFEILNNWDNYSNNQNGKMILVFSKDLREIRFSTTYEARKSIPDDFLQKLIDDQIVNNFRQEKFYEGVLVSLEEIDKYLKK